MKISTFHKQRGDIVEWYNALFDSEYDIIYCSSLFTFTDKSMVPKRAICGGTGFYPKISKLSKYIDECDYDYSIYPKCNYSMIWFTRGCFRNCPWCLVCKFNDFEKLKLKNLNPNGTYIKVMDDNMFISDDWRGYLDYLKNTKQRIDFQSVDVRHLNEEKIIELNEIKLYKQIKIAWDESKYNMKPLIEKIIKIIKPYKLMCYVLIGFNSNVQEDLFRVLELKALKVDPFVMPYNKKNRYQKDFARWVNNKATFKSLNWPEYKKRRKIG